MGEVWALRGRAWICSIVANATDAGELAVDDVKSVKKIGI